MRNAKSKTQKGKPQGRGKEFEVNVKDADVNFGDFSSRTTKGRKSGKNDVAWYSKSPALLRDAASFPYSWPVGSQLPWSDKLMQYMMSHVSGLAVLEYTPGIGRSTDAYSPINVAARNFFTYVRKANSGQTNYETSDLMMYLLAMDSAYQTYAVMVRAYGIATLFSQENRYLGRALLYALGWDPDDIYNNLAQLRYHINLLSYKLNQMCVPSSMAYMQRHAWMASGLYTDSPSPKAQIYAFNPFGYYKFTEVTSGPAYLQYKLFTNDTLWHVDEIVTAANDQLEAILSSQDFNIMSGDILKAFGESNLYRVSPIPEDFVVLPTYNQEVLSQIENCTAVGRNYSVGAGQDNPNNIVQKQNEFLESYIYYKPSYKGSIIGTSGNNTKFPNISNACRTAYEDKRIINMHKVDVTPADTMVATRLAVPVAANLDADFNNSFVIIPQSFGSEVINNIKVFSFATLNNDWTLVNPSLRSIDVHYADVVSLVLNSTDEELANAKYWLAKTAILNQFDWFPMHFAWLNTDAEISKSNGTIPFRATMDLDMYTVMNDHDLERLHEVALLSLFEVGQTGVKIGP